MPRNRNASKVSPARLVIALSFAPCVMGIPQAAWAVCNGGVTVTGTLTVSANCAGGNVKPLTLDTGANVTINSGVTVSNDAPANRNGDAISVLSSATSGTVTNNGTLSTGQQVGVWINGTLTNLINTGVISSSVRRGVVVNTGGTLVTLTNTGTILGPFAGVTTTGTLQTFNNLQGAGNVNGAVTYTGTLPTNYNIIINSPTTFGRMSSTGGTGSTTFGIYGTSTVAAGTYSSVLTGMTSSNLTGPTSGVFGGFNWLLALASGSSTTWNLVFSNIATNFTPGSTFGLGAIGTSANPVFDGGTLALVAGDNSSQAFVINSGGGIVTTPTGGTARLSGVFSGTGSVTVNGAGTLVLSGVNTYSGGTTLSSGTLTFSGNSSLGTGPVVVGSGSTLMGTGTISGALTVNGTFKPGNSPGYVVAGSSVTMNGGSTYQQDIAGTTSSGASTPVGATGYYSFLNVTGGQIVIQPNATLTPRLSNLFTAGESGFGSTPYTPVLGDRFRIITASGGISGRFSALTQPSELTAGTQFVQFYNVAGSNSLDLAVIPTSYATTLVAQNGNTRSVASALDRIVSDNQAGTATTAQDQLLSAAATRTAATLPAFTRALAGEVHAANLAVVPQATLRLQQTVTARLDSATNEAANTSGSSARSNVGTSTTSCAALTPASTWGEVSYQRGRRTADGNAGDFSSNLYQIVLGADACARHGIKVGGGIALSRTGVNGNQETGTVQQGSLFAYGKVPVNAFVLDGMASYGVHAADATRTDPTGITASLQSTRAKGNDALISAGLSRPFDMQHTRITPYARLTWQHVSQSSFGEGTSAAALSVNRFSGSGTRAVIGVTAASRAQDPLKDIYSYQLNLGIGTDTSRLVNPTLDASLAGTATSITTPGAGSSFVQAGYNGQFRFAKNAFAYLGVAVEARSHSTQGNVTVGANIKF